MRKTFQAYWPAFLILTIAVILGISYYQDYGMSYDEVVQRRTGNQFYEYVHGNNPDFINYHDRDYGSGYELPLIYIEKMFNVTDFRDVFLMRRLVTYLFFILCMFSGYVLVYKMFNNRFLAAIAMIALIFHPRLFAHSFFNTKDIPGAGIYLLILATAYWAFRKEKLLPFLVLGIVCGYGASVRLSVLILIAIISLFMGIDLLIAIFRRNRFAYHISRIILMVLGFCITIYTCWPFLWGHPVQYFLEAYKAMSNFIRWDGVVLFAGNVIRGTNLPWSYIPTWLFITTPELWIILGLIGIILLLAKFIYSPQNILLNNSRERFVLISFMSFIGPLLAAIILSSVLYDGWRHMFFIYPAFVIVAMYGLNELFKTKSKVMLGAVCLLQVILIGNIIKRNHPFEHVYFNSFISHEDQYLYKHYELEYWGTSHKDAYEWIAANDSRGKIAVNVGPRPLQDNLLFLPEPTRSRFYQTYDYNAMDYHIEDFRTFPFAFPNEEQHPGAKVVHDIKVENSTILRITKIR